jgi:hypothetical protein
MRHPGFAVRGGGTFRIPEAHVRRVEGRDAGSDSGGFTRWIVSGSAVIKELERPSEGLQVAIESSGP